LQGISQVNSRILQVFKTKYWEEVQTLHYLKMDWGEYKTEGEAKECPNGRVFLLTRRRFHFPALGSLR